MDEDRQLVRRLQCGDREALRRIYEKYKDDLLTIAACMLADRGLAEDCLHDVIVTFAGRVRELRLHGSLRSYLVTCVANRSRDRLRRQARLEPADPTDDPVVIEAVPDRAMGPLAESIHREEVDHLYRAIATLPVEQRTVITLHLHGAMTFREIAGQEVVSCDTVRSRYRYGLEKLRMLLDAGVMP